MSTQQVRPWLLAGGLSVASIIVGTIWLFRPETYPYGPSTAVSTGLNAVMSSPIGTALLLALGVLGVLVVFWKHLGHRAAPGAVVLATGFAIGLGDTSLLSSLGYGLGLALPVGGIALLLALARYRTRVAGWIVLSLLAVVAVLGILGWLSDIVALYGTYVANTIGAFGTFASPILWSWAMAATAAAWCWAAITELLRESQKHREWMTSLKLLRWGRVVTIIAALGAVPYGLLRLTWLTPWPMGGGHGELFIEELDASTRITGALFVLPCAASVVLVLGLLHRWGVVFPRWLPVIGGSPVPVRPVVIVGGAASAAITMSAPGMFIMPFFNSGYSVWKTFLWQLIFPFWMWGPALGAAVLAYWLRRAFLDRGHSTLA